MLSSDRGQFALRLRLFCDQGVFPKSADACAVRSVLEGHGFAFGLPPPRSEEMAVQQERVQQLQLGIPCVREVRRLTLTSCIAIDS